MMSEGHDRIVASYRRNYDRLARVKARYDPDNFFHVNQNQPACQPSRRLAGPGAPGSGPAPLGPRPPTLRSAQTRPSSA